MNAMALDRSRACKAMAALRWNAHVNVPTQPRRLKMTTIARVKALAKLRGLTFDALIVAMLDREVAAMVNGNGVSEKPQITG